MSRLSPMVKIHTIICFSGWGLRLSALTRSSDTQLNEHCAVRRKTARGGHSRAKLQGVFESSHALLTLPSLRKASFKTKGKTPDTGAGTACSGCPEKRKRERDTYKLLDGFGVFQLQPSQLEAWGWHWITPPGPILVETCNPDVCKPAWKDIVPWKVA
ncbi:hypothetical protein EJ04DRAFT_557307 [Polyplosphaeria fusca]|uniref:Uncharacterized protein n=1 Tax=Polyplosphaeria fusca TaxID=682080 RepID=A0A9P4UW54_9PLEO|nr:hypothetical protein EJ04DRAFT_557307 [Polyplosphaeria fusca]